MLMGLIEIVIGFSLRTIKREMDNLKTRMINPLHSSIPI